MTAYGKPPHDHADAIRRHMEVRTTVSTPEFRHFLNGLKILDGIDCHELEAAVGRMLPTKQWLAFRDHPWRFFIEADDEIKAALWKIIGTRQSEAAHEAECRSAAEAVLREKRRKRK